MKKKVYQSLTAITKKVLPKSTKVTKVSLLLPIKFYKDIAYGLSG